MSKSEESDYSRINLKDSAEEISKKIKKLNLTLRRYQNNLKSLEKKPEALNLINIYSEISKSSLDKVFNEMSGKDYSFLKSKLADLLIRGDNTSGKEITKLLEDKSHLEKVLRKR